MKIFNNIFNILSIKNLRNIITLIYLIEWVIDSNFVDLHLKNGQYLVESLSDERYLMTS